MHRIGVQLAIGDAAVAEIPRLGGPDCRLRADNDHSAADTLVSFAVGSTLSRQRVFGHSSRFLVKHSYPGPLPPLASKVKVSKTRRSLNKALPLAPFRPAVAVALTAPAAVATDTLELRGGWIMSSLDDSEPTR